VSDCEGENVERNAGQIRTFLLLQLAICMLYALYLVHITSKFSPVTLLVSLSYVRRFWRYVFDLCPYEISHV